MDFGTAISEFLANFGANTVFLGVRVCRSHFLTISGSEAGCLGLQNPGLVLEVLRKRGFSHMLGFCCFRCHFYMVVVGFGTNFEDFWWLGDRLEI